MLGRAPVFADRLKDRRVQGVALEILFLETFFARDGLPCRLGVFVFDNILVAVARVSPFVELGGYLLQIRC